MNNKLPKNKSTFNLTSIIIPFLLFFVSKGSFKINKVIDLDSDFQAKANMVKDIKPYFSYKEQYLLSKVQDVFEIINKVNRIRNDNYAEEITNQSNSLSREAKKENILAQMAKYMDDGNKEIADKVLSTKSKMDETKVNLTNHTNAVKTTEMNKVDAMIQLFNSFRPILKDDLNKKLNKMEKVMEVVRTPEDQF